MELHNEQIFALFFSGVRFPARWPELARLRIGELVLPAPLEPPQKAKRAAAKESAAGSESIPTLEITETKHGFVQRVVPLNEVRAVFLPFDVDPTRLSRENGVWLFGPQVEALFENARERAATGNPDGLGIAVVAETARVLNIVSVAASAEESVPIQAQILGTPKCGPTC